MKREEIATSMNLDLNPCRRGSITRRQFAVGSAGLLVGGATLPHSAFAKDAIEVGTVAALTGYLAGYDAHFISGLKLAVSRINATGGADGHAINLRVLDGASSATTGTTATNQLLNQYNVVAMLNGASSATSMAIQPLLSEAKV